MQLIFKIRRGKEGYNGLINEVHTEVNKVIDDPLSLTRLGYVTNHSRLVWSLADDLPFLSSLIIERSTYGKSEFWSDITDVFNREQTIAFDKYYQQLPVSFSSLGNSISSTTSLYLLPNPTQVPTL